MICDSVAVLQKAQAAPRAEAVYGEALARQLDFRTFPSSLHQRTTDASFTLENLASEPLQTDRYTATLDSPDWFIRLELVAIADIDGDGRTDGLVWFTDESKTGTYLSVQALVAPDIDSTAPLIGAPVR